MVLLKLLEFAFVEGGLIVPKVDILIWCAEVIFSFSLMLLLLLIAFSFFIPFILFWLEVLELEIDFLYKLLLTLFESPINGFIDNLGNLVSFNLSFFKQLELSNSLSWTIISSSISSLLSSIFIFFPFFSLAVFCLVKLLLLFLSLIIFKLSLNPEVKCLL